MTTRPFTVGTSFKHEHLAAIVEERPRDMFFEVHAENYMGAGGPAHRALETIRQDHPLSIHGVCLSIGGTDPLDPRHLARLREVVMRYEPALVSEHLAWSSHAGTFYNDLLPLSYTDETLATVCTHVMQIQDALKRPILLENPSTYVTFSTTTIHESAFLRTVAQRTGCGLLLDINNVFVSANNLQFGASTYLADFPLEYVGEIHLAGHSEQRDDEDAPLLIDSHDCPVASQVWTLYADVIAHAGAVPTLIEWDSQLPEWPRLHAEAQKAQRLLASAVQMHPEGTAHAA